MYDHLPAALEVLQLKNLMDNQETDDMLGERIQKLQRLATNKTALLPDISSVIW